MPAPASTWTETPARVRGATKVGVSETLLSPRLVSLGTPTIIVVNPRLS